VSRGANLRTVLLENNYPVYGKLSNHINCGGRGLCATCGIEILRPEIEPMHWHDKLAKSYRYLRLSCQITVEFDLEIRIEDDKVMWGRRLKK